MSIRKDVLKAIEQLQLAAPSQSREGQALLDQYNLITHSIFFATLIAIRAWLLIRIRRSRPEEQNSFTTTEKIIKKDGSAVPSHSLVVNP